RVQLSWWPQAVAGMPMPRRPLAGDGYALALPGGGLLCGATVAENDDEALPRARDDQHNVERLLRLTGCADSADIAHWPAPQARVGWRVATADRLPLAGALPARDTAPGTRLDQARFVPRCPGLYIAAALGSRGLGWAALVGEVVAAAIAGTPLPLEADLLDALDPARALVRAARRGR
ncbi:MAG TPA: FAD-dependent oxidoreductase, partial [Rubrivivax sp.]|nr:FAD-dependent oxidoreductase [Rubrivivax sp.]